MFTPPQKLLKAREGSLDETPLPLLLHALSAEERGGALELKVRMLQKRITFDEGAPVACRSNLLHETLGRYLVDKGRVAEADYQKALAESATGGAPMGELLVKRGLISPYDLYRQLQANLAQKVLDCFRWTDARFRLLGDDGEDDATHVRMNTAQLVLTGVTTVMPFDAVATHFTFTDDRRFAWAPWASPHGDSLRLSPKDARLVNALKDPPTFDELLARTGLDTEMAMRRLYAFSVLGLVHFSDEVPAPPAPAVQVPASLPLAPAPAPAPEPVAAAPALTPAPGTLSPVPPAGPPPGLPYADEDEAARNALMSAFLEHRGKDPFDLLGVGVDVQPAPLRKAFLALSERHGPLRFRTAELREKAEALLAAYARAYGGLAEPEMRELWLKRRRAAEEKKRGAASRPTTEEQFRIRTDLLDAQSQMAEGRQRLAQENWRGALEYFEYACDIDPRPLHRAHRAWARYLVNPSAHGKLALVELQDALREEPGLEQGWFWCGEMQRGLSDAAGAEASYRKAFKLNPSNRRYVDLIQEVSRKR